MKKIVFLLVIVGFFASCSKDETKVDVKKEGERSFLSQVVNPLAYVGEEHNSCLMAMGLDSSFATMNDIEGAQFIINWFNNKESGVVCDCNATTLNLDANSVDFDKLSLSSEVNKWFDNGQINVEQRSVLLGVDSCIKISFSHNSQFNEKCSNLETKVFNLNINESEKILLWGAIAVMRYSGNFWYNAYNDHNSPWNFTCNCSYHSGSKQTDNPNCLGHVIADVYGWCRGLLSNRGGEKLLSHAKRTAVNMSRKYDHRNDYNH